MRIKLSFLLVLISITLFSQENLEIEYEFRNVFDISSVKNQKHRDIYVNSNENRLYFELLSSEKESIFQKIDKIDNSQGKTGVSISFTSGPGGVFYKNLSDKLTVSKINYKGIDFLINDSIKLNDWILEKNKDKILGFEVRKALLKINNYSYVEAWYAPELRIKNGPSNFDGLPGIILKLIISTEEENEIKKQIYLATLVKLNDKVRINKPTKGKNISQSDFNKIIEEDNKKMNEFLNEITNEK